MTLGWRKLIKLIDVDSLADGDTKYIICDSYFLYNGMSKKMFDSEFLEKINPLRQLLS